MTDHHGDFDSVSGRSTTGHEWDGIKELNTPLPRWWVSTFYLTIVWAIGYWIVYPAWPLISGNTRAVIAYYSRADAAVRLAHLEKNRSDKKVAKGEKIFAENCVACHGDGGKGNLELGAPNLTDKIWLFGSDEAMLIETISNGRAGVMPAWEGRLDPATIKAMTVYVHSLGGGK